MDFDHFTDQQGKVVSRYVNVRVSFRLQSGGFVALGRRGSLEQPTDPFEIHPTTMIEPGFYTFGDNFFSVFTDPSRLLSGNVSISSGDFYSGKKQTYSLSGVLKLGGRLTAEAAWSFNDVDVDEGAFTTHLVTTRFVYAFSTRMFLNGLVQYNSVTEEWSSNIRFNFIYLPLSDRFPSSSSSTTRGGTIAASASTAHSLPSSPTCSISERNLVVQYQWFVH